jgi:hypothetical protein
MLFLKMFRVGAWPGNWFRMLFVQFAAHGRQMQRIAWRLLDWSNIACICKKSNQFLKRICLLNQMIFMQLKL